MALSSATTLASARSESEIEGAADVFERIDSKTEVVETGKGVVGAVAVLLFSWARIEARSEKVGEAGWEGSSVARTSTAFAGRASAVVGEDFVGAAGVADASITSRATGPFEATTVSTSSLGAEMSTMGTSTEAAVMVAEARVGEDTTDSRTMTGAGACVIAEGTVDDGDLALPPDPLLLATASADDDPDRFILDLRLPSRFDVDPAPEPRWLRVPRMVDGGEALPNEEGEATAGFVGSDEDASITAPRAGGDVGELTARWPLARVSSKTSG